MTILTRLSLVAALVLSPLGLAAQTHPPAEAAHALPSGQGHEAAPATEVHSAQEGRTPEAEEAHEGAGHHGPAMVLFGKAYGNGPAFLVQMMNFLIYLAGLVFVLKGVLSAMFRSRKEELETLLSRAERDQVEANDQMKALEAQMAGLEGELAGIMAKAESDAEVEKQRVLAAARAEAEQILARAQDEIGQQKRLAELELRALVAELAVEGATQRLEAKLAGPEAAKALDRAIQQIGGIQ